MPKPAAARAGQSLPFSLQSIPDFSSGGATPEEGAGLLLYEDALGAVISFGRSGRGFH